MPNHVLILAAVAVLPAASDAPEPLPLTIDAGRELYPADALAQRLEGEVPIKVQVSATGELRCSAAPGGPLGLLKRASCALVAQRGYLPPRVEKGVAVASEQAFVVRWNLKTDNSQFGGAIPVGRAFWVTYADYPAAASHQMMDGKVRVGFEINAFGRAENCTIKRSNTTSVLADALCPLILRRAAFLVALGPDGRPKRTTGWFDVAWRYCSNSNIKYCPKPDAGT